MSWLTLLSAFAQQGGGDREEKSERVQAAKVAFITNRLNLSTTQAQQFWPMYNEFEEARKKIRKQLRQLRIDNQVNTGTDEQIKADIRKFFQLRQEELELEKQYAEKFLKVLTPKQVAEYYRAEREFTKMLLKRLRGRRGGMNQNDDPDKEEG
jgi:Spy/CpxP family protein refolding chaperone